MIQELRIRNYSERTISTYISFVDQLESYYSCSIIRLNHEDVKTYLYSRIQKDQISVSTVNQVISAWKVVYVYLLGNEWEPFRIKRPRKELKLPEVLSQSEALALISSPSNLKHRVILHMLYSTGIRRSELIHIKPEDIDSKRMVIHIKQGKGKKDRQVTLHPKLLALLRDYYRYYRPKSYLIEGQKADHPYSGSSIGKLVENAAKRVGINKRVTAHTLRHSFATHMLEKGVNLRVIQQLLGHSSLKTTTIYLSVANIDPGTLPNPID